LGVAQFRTNENPTWNVAKLISEIGGMVVYHNLRGTAHWTTDPVAIALSKLPAGAPVILGMDNATSGSAQMIQEYGDPQSCVVNALHGPWHLDVLNWYQADITAACQGDATYATALETVRSAT
jgi:hypothetical protein